jgi:hypothetical protein
MKNLMAKVFKKQTIRLSDSFIVNLYWQCNRCKRINHPIFTSCQECGHKKIQ